MWTCRKCQSDVEDNFGMCWNCGTSKAGMRDPEFRSEAAEETDTPEAASALECLRCKTGLTYLGRRSFEDGSGGSTGGDGLLLLAGALGSFFRSQEYLDVYCCQKCGHIDLFVDGVGEERRR